MICYQVSFSLRHLTPPSLRSVEPSPFLHRLPFVNRMIVDFGSFWCWLLFCCVGKHLILTIRLPVSCILSTWISTNADVNAVTVSSRWERAGVSRGTGSAGIYQRGRWSPSHDLHTSAVVLTVDAQHPACIISDPTLVVHFRVISRDSRRF